MDLLGDSFNLSIMVNLAMEENRMDVLEYHIGQLVENGHDKNVEINSLLHFAATCGYAEAIKWLKAMGANLNSWDNEGRSPVHNACLAGKIESIKCLKELGADIQERNNDGLTPMISAATRGKVDIIKCLYELGANLNTKGGDGKTPMICAAMSGQIESIKCLVALGGDVNAGDDDGRTPMFWAAAIGQIQSIKNLKMLGADVNARDNEGNTPMFLAAITGQVESIEYLDALGADVNAKNNSGQTPIFGAVSAGKLECIKRLKSRGADINIKANNGNTPLIFAENLGDVPEVVEWLCANVENKKQKVTTEKSKKTRIIIGTILQLALTVVFIFLLFNPEIIRPQFTEYLNNIENAWKLLFMMVLPFGIVSVAMGIISLLVLRRCNSLFGLLFIFIMDIVYTIGCVIFFEGGFSISLFLGYLFVNTNIAIPGVILMMVSTSASE